jgi:hypothetical protein
MRRVLAPVPIAARAGARSAGAERELDAGMEREGP